MLRKIWVLGLALLMVLQGTSCTQTHSVESGIPEEAAQTQSVVSSSWETIPLTAQGDSITETYYVSGLNHYTCYAYMDQMHYAMELSPLGTTFSCVSQTQGTKQTAQVVLDENTGVSNVIWEASRITFFQVSQYDQNAPEYRVVLVDWSGVIQKDIPVDFFEEGEYPLSMCYADQQTLLISTEQNIYGINLTEDTNYLVATLEAPATLIRGGDELVYIYEDESAVLKGFDSANGTVGDTICTLSQGDYITAGFGVYPLCVIGEAFMYGIDMENRSIVELLCLEDISVDSPISIFNYDTEQWIVSFYSSLSHEVKLVLVRTGDAPEGKEIIVASQTGRGWDNLVREAADEFEIENTGYHVSYYEYADIEQLQIAMTAGDSPDLIEITAGMGIDADWYGYRGYFQNLYSFFSEDSLTEEDLVPAYLSVAEAKNGELYAMSPNFLFRTLVTTLDVASNLTEEGWSVAEFVNAAMASQSEMAISDDTGASFFSYVLQQTINNYVDFEQATCNFEQDDFISLLNLCGMMPSSAEELPSLNGVGSVANGQVLCQTVGVTSGLHSIEETLQDSSMFGIVGYPGTAGNGAVMYWPCSYAIPTSAKNAEDAWKFLSALFSYNVQSCMPTGLPVLSAAFTDAVENEIASGLISAESAERWMDYMEHIQTHTLYDSPIYTMIDEETAAFFAGDKTAAEVASIIQNRAMIYLSEQS